MPDTICAFPWVHLAADTTGEMIICCNTYYHDREHVVKKNDGTDWNLAEITEPLTYFNSDYYKAVRLKMIKGEKPKVCKKCYDIEENGGYSIRQHSLHEFNLQNLLDQTNLETGELNQLTLGYVHFMWGNKCNLKCKMCGPWSSDQLIEEFKAMGIKNVDQIQDTIQLGWDYKKIEKVLKSIAPYIEKFNVTGGEPLINNDYLDYCYYLHDNGYSKNISLAFHTNLTVLPSKFVEIWKNFKDVTVKVSIDATGKDYEYIRYPGKWDVIDRNIKRLEEISKEMPMLGIEFHSVFSSYNAHAVPDLIRYLYKIKSRQILNFPNTLQVTGPLHADSRCIPRSVKQQIADELETLIGKFSKENNQRVRNNIGNLKSNIKYMLSSDLEQKKFIEFNQSQDRYRTIKTENIVNWYKK